MKQRLAVMSAAVSTVSVAACGPETSAPPAGGVSLVVISDVRTAAGAPKSQAMVHLQALRQGRSSGELGCTGSSLIGDKAGLTGDDGRLAMELGAGSIGGNSVCIIALAKRLGAAKWGDTVSFVYPFIPRKAVTPPDTVPVELRLP